MVTGTSNSTISLSWQPPSFPGTGGLASYHLYIGTRDIVTAGTSYTAVALTPNTNYSIYASASSNRGLMSDPSNVVTAFTGPTPVTYPYTVTFDQSMGCGSGCAGEKLITTQLDSVTVKTIGDVDINVTYTNHTNASFSVVFNPPDSLHDGNGNNVQAFADVGGTGSITVPANSSTNYTISFSGLSPLPGAQCKFYSDVYNEREFNIGYPPVSVPCI
jgi:hypothetical protein